MKLEEIQHIAVLGSGIMGHGIAQRFIMGAYPVMLYDIEESILATAMSHIEKNLELFCQSGIIGKKDIEASLQRLSTSADLKQAVEGSDFIVEAAPEDLGLKQDLFAQVESFCRKDTIIASNTSSLTMADMGVRVKNKERLIITHWFNPPHIVPTVEVVKAEWTNDESMETTYGLLKKIDKMPVKINRELPGFIVNRVQMAMYREIVDLYEKGVAGAEDIDKAIRGSIGFRLASIGPLLTMDLAGIKLFLKVYENLVPQIQSSTGPPKSLQDMVSEGCDGIKSGKGYFDYAVDFSKGDFDEVIQKRDREFLGRLKNLYLETKIVK